MMMKMKMNSSINMMLLATIAVAVISVARCSPPEDPVDCSGAENSNCTVTNSYGAFPDRSICRAAKAVYPTSEAEVVAAVAEATKNNKKMKVVSRYSHSIPKLVCPDGDDGVLISTKYLNRTLSFDTSAMTATVESGVTLRQLIDEAGRANMALPYAPYWWGLTVGGMIGTGAHGSSLWGSGSQVHDYVTRLTIVSPGEVADGYAKLRVLETGDPDLDAARVSLGVLGVVTQVTLKLERMFKRSVTYTTKNDSDLGEAAVKFGREHEFADFIWYPSQKSVEYRIDDRVSTNASGDGFNDSPGFRSTSAILASAVRGVEESQESLGDANGKCTSGIITTTTLRAIDYGLTNDDILSPGYPVVGYQSRIQASGSCLDSPDDESATGCPWDPRIQGVFFHQTTFSINLSNVTDFIHDVQKLVELSPESLCGLDLYNGILMRYVTASTAYLGKQEDGVDFDITYYRSKDPLKPRLFQDVLEEIEQMAVFKYGALPHWGKNRNVAFLEAIQKYRNATHFIQVKDEYDPLGLFSSEWTDQILGIKDGLSVVKEGCALEGLCICSQDIHCAPAKGYMCRPGKVYEEARVCAKSVAPIPPSSSFTTFTLFFLLLWVFEILS